MKINGKKVKPQIGGILSKKPWKGYARGGSLPEDELYDPSHGGTVPRALQNMMPQAPDSWRRPPQRRAEGGGVDDFLDLPLANPSFDERWLDRAGGVGTVRPSKDLKIAMTRDVGEPAIGDGGTLFEGNSNIRKGADIASKLGYNMMHSTATLPFRYMKSMVDTAKMAPGSEEAHEGYRGIGDTTAEMALSMFGPKGGGSGSTAGVMVGPYGAHMLRQAARANEHDYGSAVRDFGAKMPVQKPHPVYAKEVAAGAERLRPEFRDAYTNWQMDARDAMARQALETRPLDQSTSDIWKMSGWSRGAAGEPFKEIVDSGAKLKPLYKGSDKYYLDHPAGDLHKIYDIPPIKVDPSIRRAYNASAVVNSNTGQIVVADKKNVSSVLHEVQHIIDKKEGGSRPMTIGEIPNSPEMKNEMFPMSGGEWWQATKYMPAKHHIDEQLRRYERRLGPAPADLRDKMNRPIGEELARDLAKDEVYRKQAGEVKPRNVQRRFEKSFRYQTEPEFTEDISRGLQTVNKDLMPRPVKVHDNRNLREIAKSMVKGDDYRTTDLRKAIDNALEDIRENNRRRGYADGGEVESNAPWFTKASARSSGMLKSTIPGRTDKIPLKVGGGSYVLPADIPSALGQGNTMAGSSILDKMFNRGPYGMNLPKAKAGQSTKMSRMSSLTKTRVKTGYADGGETTETPIIAAGGEYILSPDQVLQVGGGDMTRGHDILDQFVLSVRKEHIKTLKGLRPPKKD